MQTDVYIKIINEKMNIKFWSAGFLVIPKVYAVIASPFSKKQNLLFLRHLLVQGHGDQLHMQNPTNSSEIEPQFFVVSTMNSCLQHHGNQHH